MKNYFTYKNYIGTVDYSREDEIFYGKIHGINDLILFEGKSVDQLKTAFKEAVEDYLQTCIELKKDPQKSYKGSFNIRISSTLHQKAAELAAIRKMTLNEFVKEAIAKEVGQR